MKIYCVHHSDALDRKIYISNIFKKYNIEINWIVNDHPNDIKEKYSDKIIYSEHAANNINLNIFEISCFLKHKNAIEQISKTDEFGIIIEDDIKEPSFDFISIVEDLCCSMKNNNCDILFIGSFANYDLPNINDNPYIVCNNNTMSRCCHAYIVNNNIAEVLSNYLDTIKAPLDWQINYAIQDLNLKSCWSYPQIYQRTEKKELNSLLR